MPCTIQLPKLQLYTYYSLAGRGILCAKRANNWLTHVCISSHTLLKLARLAWACPAAQTKRATKATTNNPSNPTQATQATKLAQATQARSTTGKLGSLKGLVASRGIKLQ